MSVTAAIGQGGIERGSTGQSGIGFGAGADTGVLERNLAALARTSPDAAARVRSTPSRADVRLETASDGGVTGTIGGGDGARLLASRRAPLEEARRLAEGVDLHGAAVFFVVGFGLGHHAAALARRVGKTGVVIVFEPDAGLLRAALERVDMAAVFAECNLAVLTDADDTAAMGEVLRGGEGLVGLGVTIVEHPASRARLAGDAPRAMANFTSVVEAVKMTVVTTLVQAKVTIRNLLQNLDAYAACAGVDAVKGAAAGRPAVVVSAGPSLKRNVHLLKEEGLTDRCAMIAVQTVLRPLLEMGVRPHFVTALDYSEINRRFYEGLTPEMVEGVTLVVEPKVNPAVLEAWPGAVLCVADRTLDLVLGEKLGRSRGELKQGATVAHLAYYLARHLGCDPVALVGQDLGFTDNQYYAAGASIHTVWGSELNAFKSLELLEWQRIARMGPHLRKATDTLGRAIYTDEQMLTYLRQFEQDFRVDGQRGLRVVDATEGGVRKLGAEALTLDGFLAAHVRGKEGGLDAALRGRAGGVSVEARRRAPAPVRERLAMVRRQVGRIGDLSRQTATLLAELLEHQQDLARVDGIIGKIEVKRDEVEGLKPGFTLVNLFAQTAVFNRIRADRAITLGTDLEPLERQRLQAERDAENVRTLARAADDLGGLLDAAGAALAGGPKATRDLPKTVEGAGGSGVKVKAAAVVDAVVPVDLGRSGLLTPRRLEGPFAGHASVLSATVARLLRVPGLRSVVLTAEDAQAARAMLEPSQRDGGQVTVIGAAPSPAAITRRRAVAAGRLWARACWRGGLADLTIYDELLDPGALGPVLDRCGATAALLAGPDWCAVDPALCGLVIERHAEDPDAHRVVFTQAAPGLCGAVVSRALCGQLAVGEGWERNAFASLGGILGYIPIAPAMDLIAHAVCVGVEPGVRDAGVRAVADTPWVREAIAAAAEADADAATVCARLGAMVSERPGSIAGPAPAELEIDAEGVGDREIVGVIRSAAKLRGDLALTLSCAAGDAARAWTLAREARIAGVAGVHVRLRGAAGLAPELAGVLDAPVDVLSVETPPGEGGAIDPRWAQALRAALAARNARVGDATLATPWIVPRLTRSDAAHALVERFIGEHVMLFGWAALDPMDPGEAAARAERVRPLPWPSHAAARRGRTTLALRGGEISRAAVEGMDALWAARLAQGSAR